MPNDSGLKIDRHFACSTEGEDPSNDAVFHAQNGHAPNEALRLRVSFGTNVDVGGYEIE